MIEKEERLGIFKSRGCGDETLKRAHQILGTHTPGRVKRKLRLGENWVTLALHKPDRATMDAAAFVR
jgi:hypothetical protein